MLLSTRYNKSADMRTGGGQLVRQEAQWKATMAEGYVLCLFVRTNLASLLQRT